MFLRLKCSDCKGTGQQTGGDPPASYPCPNCNGIGYNAQEIISDELTDILSKCEHIKAKLNQMQADINYIKAKVG